MGNGWFGNGWFGNGWFGNGWLGNGWFDAPDAGGAPVVAMRTDRPLTDTVLPSYNFGVKFPASGWDPDLLALMVLPEFLAQKIGGKDWKEAVIAALPGPTTPITQAMIDDVINRAITERPEALGEIVQEHSSFQFRFLHLLNMSRGSHPATFLLMKLAARVGELSMMTLKRLQSPWDARSRPRPSQVCPTLFPALPVPGHATYPAGHALIAWLTAACLQDIPALKSGAYSTSIDALATRVGDNRVNAGLHFQEDVDHGKIAGKKIHEFIKECVFYKDTLNRAKQEWN